MDEIKQLGDNLQGYFEDYKLIISKYPDLKDNLSFEAFLNYASRAYYMGTDLYQKLEEIGDSIEGLKK